MDSIQTTGNEITEQVPFQMGTVHHDLSNIAPASSEVAHLWTGYLAETIATCFLKKYVAQCKDPDFKPILQKTLDISTQRVITMENLFKAINYPIPQGFGEKDVDVNTPVLFSDTFICLYTRLNQKLILTHYSSASTTAYRSDFRDYYDDCIKTSNELHRIFSEVLLAKGVLQKHPTLVPPTTLENVSSKNYLGTYLHISSDTRPLNAMEISHIYNLIENKQILRALNLGHSQTVSSERIKNYLKRYVQVADKHLEKLIGLLKEQHIPVPTISEVLITDTRVPSFSERLILFHTTATLAYVITEYGLAIPNIMRKDLGVTILDFMTEVTRLAKDGAELLIELGWLEKSPETADREKLTH